MTDYQYVILSNRLTPFNDTYTNNVVDVDVKKSSQMFSCNLSKTIKLEPYSEVRLSYYHLSKNNITNNIVSLGIVCPNLPINSTNIGNPYNNRLVKLVGLIDSPNRNTIGSDSWVSCNNTHVETLTSIDCQIIRLGDGREPKNNTDAGITADGRILVNDNITIGLQFRINPHKKALAIAYKNNELLRGHLSSFKPNLINKNDPSYIQPNEITAPNYKKL